jgi:DNA-binding TFAR19-related protein (PDSD5 family)
MKKDETDAQFNEALSRLLKPEARQRLELLLLERIKQCKAELEKMLETMSGR